MPAKGPDLTGQTFGYWTVLGEAEKLDVNRRWFCRCACGTERAVQQPSLNRGGSQSCGCQQVALGGLPLKSHGMTKHRAYKSWISLRARCNNPNDTGYADYGGRGITVCARWEASFEAFWEDMGPTWFPKATIERRDVNGNYEPGNCCWIGKTEQPKNRRMNVFIDTPWGSLTLAEAARKIGLSPMAFGRRYNRGWRGEKLFEPPAEKGARITPRTAIYLDTPFGRLDTNEAAERLGISVESLRHRLRRGETAETLFS